jgi:hypothetical protein
MRNIRKHYLEEHEWENPKGRGRPKRDVIKLVPDVPWRSGVLYQRFFVQGPKSGYFKVRRDQGEN